MPQPPIYTTDNLTLTVTFNATGSIPASANGKTVHVRALSVNLQIMAVLVKRMLFGMVDRDLFILKMLALQLL